MIDYVVNGGFYCVYDGFGGKFLVEILVKIEDFVMIIGLILGESYIFVVMVVIGVYGSNLNVFESVVSVFFNVMLFNGVVFIVDFVWMLLGFVVGEMV